MNLFSKTSGVKGKNSSGGPSVLIAYGKENLEILKESKLKGALVTL